MTKAKLLSKGSLLSSIISKVKPPGKENQSSPQPSTRLQDLPEELLLLIISCLPFGPSVLLGLTCRRLYRLHRTVRSFPITLEQYCPNATTCTRCGTPTFNDCRSQSYSVVLSLCGESDCPGFPPMGYQPKLYQRLEGWMGPRWEYCPTCTVFHRLNRVYRTTKYPCKSRKWGGIGKMVYEDIPQKYLERTDHDVYVPRPGPGGSESSEWIWVAVRANQDHEDRV